MRKLKNALLTVAIILIAAGAAFATRATRVSDNASETGYYFNNSTKRCMETEEQCNPSGSVYCTWADSLGTHQLSRKISGTMCGDPLYKR